MFRKYGGDVLDSRGTPKVGLLKYDFGKKTNKTGQ